MGRVVCPSCGAAQHLADGAEPATTPCIACKQPLVEATGRLVALGTDGDGWSWNLIRSLVIGSDDACDVPLLGDDAVAVRHAEVFVGTEGRIGVRDLGSTTGTFVNGGRIRQVALSSGDLLQIGSSGFRVEVFRKAPATPPPVPPVAPAAAPTQIQCPECAEMIQARAKLCRYCGCVLENGQLVRSAHQAALHRGRTARRMEAEPPPHAVEAPVGVGRHVVAIICAATIVAGCFLPWLQFGVLVKNTGVDNPDGLFMLTVALIAGGMALYNAIARRRGGRWGYILTGVGAAIIAAVDLAQVLDRAREAAKSFAELGAIFNSNTDVDMWKFVGIGLYVVMAGALGLVIAGLIPDPPARSPARRTRRRRRRY